MRPIIVGESNPYGADPAFALYPAPERSAGARLCREILEMRRGQYLCAFDRVNLLAGPRWSVPEARRSASQLLRAEPRRAIFVLLGARVAEAFGLEFEPATARTLRIDDHVDSWGLMIPHPSGRCRLWNQPGMLDRVRHLVRSFCRLEPATGGTSMGCDSVVNHGAETTEGSK